MTRGTNGGEPGKEHERERESTYQRGRERDGDKGAGQGENHGRTMAHRDEWRSGWVTAHYVISTGS